ncbi:MAG: TolC family protein, partial [Pseudomonadota bacterium]
MKGHLPARFFSAWKHVRFRVIAGTVASIAAFSLCFPPISCGGTKDADMKIKREMTLADCVFLALRKNRTIESAYLDRVVQKFGLKVAEDEFFPQLTIKPSIKRTDTGDGETRSHTDTGEIATTVTEKIPLGTEFSFTWTDTGERQQGDTLGYSYSSAWNLGIKQPLLKGAGTKIVTTSLNSARINEQINILSLRSTIIDTITSAISAYRSFFQAQKQLEIAESSLERSKELLEVNRELIAVGRMAQVEIIQTLADVANKEFSFTQARNALDAARLSLLQVLDIDKHTIIITTEKMETKPVHPDLARCQALAVLKRPDYLQSLLNHKVAELDLAVAENNLLWDLSLDGSYGITG